MFPARPLPLAGLQTSQESTQVTSLVTRLQSESVAEPNPAASITANLLLSSPSLGGKT